MQQTTTPLLSTTSTSTVSNGGVFVTPASIVQYRGILFGPKAKANLVKEKMYPCSLSTAPLNDKRKTKKAVCSTQIYIG